MVANTRLAHFDILTKVAALEVDGLDSGLRFDDIKSVFADQKNFSGTSAVAKRIKSTLDFLRAVFPSPNEALKNRTIVQTVVTFAARLVETGKHKGLESNLAAFIEHYVTNLGQQVELGQSATDYDYIRFQRTVNANVKAGARLRQEILLRKAFMFDGAMADAFDPSVLVASGVAGRVKELGDAISDRIGRLNSAYSGKHGEDLFKATNKTTQALLKLGKPIKTVNGYKNFIDDLYFVFREGIGSRLDGHVPQSFVDVNTLRTDLQHDVDHGAKGKITSKKKKIGTTFSKYAGTMSPQLLDPTRFLLVQANLLSALDLDLKNITIP